MLSSSPISDPEIELLLTLLRVHLLKLATTETIMEFGSEKVLYCSLAQQCFINEYVYFQTPFETEYSQQLLNQLIKALEKKQHPPEILVVTVACYFPLYSIRGSERLLQQDWSADVKKVLKQQIQEPLE
jgi:hypothetical protein